LLPARHARAHCRGKSLAILQNTVEERRSANRRNCSNWGAALEGDVAIPRSALGIDRERRTLYFSISNDTTPRVIADGMLHAGATDIAQFDVNWPNPRFVVFRPDKSGNLNAAGVVKGVLFHPDDYIRKPARRDC
jgi:hypothetical protein